MTRVINNTKHKQPNTTTAKAMKAAKKGKTTKHKNAKELISFLNK